MRGLSPPIRELGVIRKKWTGRLPVALLFPNIYRLAMSNLGMQLVYHHVNQHPDVVCERLFLPDDASAPRSLESSRPLTDFPVVFCAISFEQDFVNLGRLFIAGGIAPRAADRAVGGEIAAGNPLVVAGGVATFINPEPLAPCIDLFILGEAEPALDDLLERLLPLRHAPLPDRDALLVELANTVSGSYAPRLYHTCSSVSGAGGEIRPLRAVPCPVRKRTLADCSVAGHSRLLTAATEFSDLFLVELGRGCSRGCRFCAAGFVYRPPRLWNMEAISAALREKAPEIKRVGLLGMEMARPGELEALSSLLADTGCTLSFSSLRADALGPELLSLLGQSGLKSAAIAPDGGSERLRRVINKGLEERHVLDAARMLVESGVNHLKLYYMVGLPTEVREDIDELADCTLRILEEIGKVGRARGRQPQLTVSLNCFVPKAWTPFQFAPFAGVKPLKEKIDLLRRRFKGRANLRLNADKPDNALLQAVLARGDRRVGELLIQLAGSQGNWRQLFRRQGVDWQDYVGARDKNDCFPWEVIDHGVRRDYLWAEYRRALTARPTPPCDVEKCRRCGVCRGET